MIRNTTQHQTQELQREMLKSIPIIDKNFLALWSVNQQPDSMCIHLIRFSKAGLRLWAYLDGICHWYGWWGGFSAFILQTQQL